MRKILLLVAAAVAFSFSAAFAGEGEKCTAKCDKDAAKCCAESDSKVVLTQVKAEALAKAIKSEGCAVKSGELLASVLPGLKCKETLAKLSADIKSKECSGEAANLILAAVKQYGAPEKNTEKKPVLTAQQAEELATKIKSEGCAVKSGEILASVLPGLKCKESLAKLTADVKAKECSKEAANLILAAVKEYGATQKNTEKKAVLTAEKAEELATKIKSEGCCEKSGEILASVLPGLKCKETLAKLTAEVKAKECSKEAANLILAAVKEYGAIEKNSVLTAEKAEELATKIKSEGCCEKSGEILASVLPGLKCKETLAKLTAEVKAKECSKEAANLILAAVKKYGCEESSCEKGKAIALNAEKAVLIAAQIRSENCPVKSSEILASALPELKCKETLAKLITEIKGTGCEKEASDLILAAQAKLAPKPEAKQ